VHRDDQRRLERGQHFHHAVEIKRITAVDGRHDHVHAADLVKLLLRQRMMQMSEMRDAQIGNLEDKDRVAVTLGRGAAVEAPDIGRHVAHPHVAIFQVPVGGLIGILAPTPQHVFDRRVGIIGVMRVVRMIHGDNIRQQPRLNVTVVIGGNAHELRALDQESRVAEKGQADLV